jgi:hypothetical protein
LPKLPRRYNDLVRFAAFLLLALACSSTPEPTDAGGMDAEPDAGSLELACKGLTCNAVAEYCKLTPVAACTIVDAGSCPSGQETCVTTGGSGCTPDRTPSCALLAGCTNCPCLIAKSPCGAGTMSITCRSSGGTISLECPYP